MKKLFLLSFAVGAILLLSACNFGGGSSTSETETSTEASSSVCYEHTWDEGAVAYPSTCAVQGMFVYTCTACGETEIEWLPLEECTFSDEWSKNGSYHWHAATCGHAFNIADEAPHTWGEGTVTRPATCAKEGVIEYSCTVCGAEGSTYIPKTEHTYSDEWSSSGASHWREAICGCSAETDSARHTWDDGNVTLAATCGDDGVFTYTCTVCSRLKTESISATGNHSWGEPYVIREPSCTVMGEKYKDCTVCGDSVRDSFIDTIPHPYDDIVREPTCTETGITKHVCSACGKNYSDGFKEARGHSYETAVIAPTCTEIGYSLHVCSRCDDDYKDAFLGMRPHAYETAVTAPTCAAEGYTTHTCKDCEKTYTDTPVEKLPHTYAATVVDPTCAKAGYTDHVCSACGDRYQDAPVAKLPHEYGEGVVTAPTCTARGYSTYSCLHCDYSYRSKFTPVIAHNYVNVICTECGVKDYSIGLDYTLSEDGTYYTVSGIGSCADTELVLPRVHEGLPVRAIAPSAFAGNTAITSLVFHPGDESQTVGERAFAGCTALVSVTLPVGVTGFGASAFLDCSALTGVYIEDLAAWCGIEFADAAANPLHLAHKLYINNSLPSEVRIDGVTAIQPYAFTGCSTFRWISFSDSITYIGFGAFKDCTAYDYFLPFIGERLDGTGATHAGYIFGAETYEDQGACFHEDVRGLIYNGGTTVAPYTFYGCSTIRTIRLPDTVTTIDPTAFLGCTSLNTIDLPFVGEKPDGTGATHFGYVFGAPDLESQADYIPATLRTVNINGGTAIASYAFKGCAGIDQITLPATVTSIGTAIFSGCGNLTRIIVDDQNERYHSDGNCLIETEAKLLIAGSSRSVIPDDGSVTKIDNYAFQGCTGLTTITIPGPVIGIRKYAFEGCTGLTEVIFELHSWRVSYLDDDVVFPGNAMTSPPKYAANALTSYSSGRYWYREVE